ncbi:MAG: hypothetical protein LBG57_00945 [Treponema sp.]|jgi:hypothetical protein|nr:hypothetical protein [Treponema sp.]
MKKKSAILFLFISAAVFVFSQDEAGRPRSLLDRVLNTASELGRSSAPNSENPTFNILNKTGFTIKSVSVSRANTGGRDAVSFSGNLYNDESLRVSLKASLNEINSYNIRVVDEDGAYYSKRNVEITESAVIEIRISDLEG